MLADRAASYAFRGFAKTIRLLAGFQFVYEPVLYEPVLYQTLLYQTL